MPLIQQSLTLLCLQYVMKITNNDVPHYAFFHISVLILFLGLSSFLSNLLQDVNNLYTSLCMTDRVPHPYKPQTL